MVKKIEEIENANEENKDNFKTCEDSYTAVSKMWEDSYTKLYLSYTDSILKLSLKSAQLSQGNASPEAYKEFHTLWMNTYQEIYGKAFDNLFDNTPTFSPFKEILEPVKNAAKIYADTFASVSNAWVKSYPYSTIAV